MGAKKYRKKPVVIEAIQYNGKNEDEIEMFVGDALLGIDGAFDNPYLYIATLEGTMTASKGDYIIKGVDGEFYPCKPDIFKKTYEEIGYEDNSVYNKG